MEQDWLWGDCFQTASWLRSSLETSQKKRFSFPGLASSLPTTPLSSKGYSSLSEYATHLPVTKLKVKSNIILVKCSINAHSNWILKIRLWIFSCQTVKVSGIALQDTEMFSHGQLYVALSRCGENKNITILCDRTKKTKNIVYQQALTRIDMDDR